MLSVRVSYLLSIELSQLDSAAQDGVAAGQSRLALSESRLHFLAVVVRICVMREGSDDDAVIFDLRYGRVDGVASLACVLARRARRLFRSCITRLEFDVASLATGIFMEPLCRLKYLRLSTALGVPLILLCSLMALLVQILLDSRELLRQLMRS